MNVPGGYKPIQEMQVGDEVLRPNGPKEIIPDIVEEIFEGYEDLISLVTTHGALLTTPTQLFRCLDGQDRQTTDLKDQFVGYLLDGKELIYVRVVAVLPKGTRAQVWHLRVRNDPHLYFVEDFLVHNKGGGGGGTSTTTQETKIPDELKPLYKQTASIATGIQRYRPRSAIQATPSREDMFEGFPERMSSPTPATRLSAVQQPTVGLSPEELKSLQGNDPMDINSIASLRGRLAAADQQDENNNPLNVAQVAAVRKQLGILGDPEFAQFAVGGPGGTGTFPGGVASQPSGDAADFTGGSIMDEFLDPRIMRTAGLSRLQRLALAGIPGITDVPGSEDAARLSIGLAPLIAGQRPTGFNGIDVASGSIDPLRGLAERLPNDAELLSEAGGSRARLQSLYERLPTGGTLETSPALKAADDYFKQLIEPTLVNQMTLSGLGRGTALSNALAKGKATYMVPLVQEELAREERSLQGGAGAAERAQARLSDILSGRVGREQAAIERGTGVAERGVERLMGAGEAELGRGERAISRRADAVQAGIQPLMGLGATERAARLRQLEELQKGGELERSIEQEQNVNEQRDLLRRQAIGEQSIFGPLGQFVPSTLGQSSTTTSKQSGGGGMTWICSETYRQGRMSKAMRDADEEFGASLDQETYEGYLMIAVPVASAMRKSKLFSALIIPLVLLWGREMQRRVIKEGRGSLFGKFVLWVGLPFCSFLGRCKNSIFRMPSPVKSAEYNTWRQVITIGPIRHAKSFVFKGN